MDLNSYIMEHMMYYTNLWVSGIDFNILHSTHTTFQYLGLLNTKPCCHGFWHHIMKSEISVTSLAKTSAQV